jgi:xanthine dehydrogenase molybdopterin binding subunit/xanthine dehydrogenase small subunit
MSQRDRFEVEVDGRSEVVRDVDAATSLLDWLRDTGRTGTKEGCAEGDCGACTVAMLDVDSNGDAAWRSLCACITPLPTVAGRRIVTVEGLADGPAVAGNAPSLEELHPVQRAMVEKHGSQCGFCTPGFVVSMFEGFVRKDLPDTPSYGEVSDQLCGNLCRCTGYRPIREAMTQALSERELRADDRFAKAQQEPAASVPPLNYAVAGNAFLRPTSVSELVRLLAANPEACLIAGATEIGVYRNKRFEDFPLLVSTDGVPELRAIERTDDAWLIGGGATITDIEDAVGPEVPALGRMINVFASRQIRNRATVAGNLITASPIGDLAPVLLALDASVTLEGPEGEREVPLDAFFTGYRQTVRQPDEVLTRVRLPHPGQGVESMSFKVSKRRELDIAIVSACFSVSLSKDGRVQEARLAYGGVAATPIRAKATEQALIGRPWILRTVKELRAGLEAEFTPLDDVRSGASFRRDLVGSLLEKFVIGDFAPSVEGPLTFESDESFADSRKAAESFALHHESAIGHATGRARYVDDAARSRNCLVLWPVMSTHAHADITSVDTTAAWSVPGVVDIVTAKEIPGVNDVGALREDEPALADGEVVFHGQMIAVVAASTYAAARKGAEAVELRYAAKDPVLTIDESVSREWTMDTPHVIARGDVDGAFDGAPHQLSGRLEIGGQEHFYLESQAASARPGEHGDLRVQSSTQHPAEVQAIVAKVVGLPKNRVVVESPRMGGGFGGKETQANGFAALAAVVAWRTGRAVRWMLDRDLDLALTGKRHPFVADWKAGFDDEGRLLAFDADLVADGGYAWDLSGSIRDRALYHLDNAYDLPNVRFKGRVARTNKASFTAFRGFGGPQGMVVVEEVMDQIAEVLGIPASVVRARNFYEDGGSTPYGQGIGDARIGRLWAQLMESSEFVSRRESVSRWNSRNRGAKRGLAITPIKFGISFTASYLNQAGALVLVYKDGSCQVNHGGTEMGQGLYTKMQGVAMRELGLTAPRVRVMKTRTDKIPNTSATAASAGADLNGAAVANACAAVRSNMAAVAVELFAVAGVSVSAEDLTFADDRVTAPDGSDFSFGHVATQAWLSQVPLSATGFYATPGLHYDRDAGRGRPFHYFTWGAAVTEVEVDGHTGMKRMRRVDILQDVGDSLNPEVDRGQVEGAFVQGAGWLTCEELKWTDAGRITSHSASTYAIPAFGDAPADLRIGLLEQATQPGVIHGSKAVGEPPFMLALSVRSAIKDAIAAFGGEGPVLLECPATHEAIRGAIRERVGASLPR